MPQRESPVGDSSSSYALVLPPVSQVRRVLRGSYWQHISLPSDKYPQVHWMTPNFSSLIRAIMRLFPRHWSPVQSSWRSPSRLDGGGRCHWRNWDTARLPSQVQSEGASISTNVKCCLCIQSSMCSTVLQTHTNTSPRRCCASVRKIILWTRAGDPGVGETLIIFTSYRKHTHKLYIHTL